MNEFYNLPIEKLREALENMVDPAKFCQVLFQTALNETTEDSIKLIFQTLLLGISFKLKEEISGYFSLPIFTKLSVPRLKFEIESCQDIKLEEAVVNISAMLNEENNIVLKLQAEFFNRFIDIVLKSNDSEYIGESLRLIALLLLQPSFRRFIKPLLEDRLFLSSIKFAYSGTDLIRELESIFFYPIDELSGVNFESSEDYISAQYAKIRNIQEILLEFDELSSIAKLPLNAFNNYQQISSSINQLTDLQIGTVLSSMGSSGYPEGTPREVLIDSIASGLLLRTSSTEHFSVFPTEVI